jgi:tRNA(adenine34) deaminase
MLTSETPADETFMRLALDEAARAAAGGDVPVGAVAVVDGEVVGRQYNRKEALADPTAHAEILLLREVSERLGRWRLPDVTIYCTMEPCAMCAGAMVQARIGRLVYAAPDSRAGAAGSVFDVVRSPVLNHRVAVTSGILAEVARAQLDRFFAALRRRRQAPVVPVVTSETANDQEADQTAYSRPESGPIG